MHQRAGLKLHHGGMPNAPTGRLLRREKQNEKCIASPANVPERERCLTKRVPVNSINPAAGPSSPSES